jgi:hypothetical protein
VVDCQADAEEANARPAPVNTLTDAKSGDMSDRLFISSVQKELAEDIERRGEK